MKIKRNRQAGVFVLATCAWMFGDVSLASGEPLRNSMPYDQSAKRIEVLRGLTSSGQANPDLLSELGWLLYRYGEDSAGALAAAERACEMRPDHFKACELTGRLKFLSGREDETLDHWLTLLDDDRPEVPLYLSAVASLANTSDAIARTIKRIRDVAKDHPSAPCRTIASRILADHDLSRGRIDEAARAYRALGTIDSWMVIGPFANERHAGYGTAYDPEEEVDFTKSYSGRDRMVGWRALNSLTFRGEVDFAAVQYPREQVLAYAAVFVHSPSAKPATLRVGVKETVKVWFNDRLAYASDLERRFAPDQFTVPVELREGWNKLLVKVGVETGAWRLAVRLTDTAGVPLTDVTYSRTAHATPNEVSGVAPSFAYATSMMDHFAALRDVDAGNEDAWYYLGLAQQAAGLNSEASKSFEKLANLNGRCSDHHRLLARAYLQDDKADKALAELKRAVELDENNLIAQMMIARFYNQRRLFRKEQEVLESIEAIRPGWRELDYQWLDHFRDQGWEELAFRRGQKLYDSRPTDLRAAVVYARMCGARGYFDRLKPLIEHILTLDYAGAFAMRESLTRAVTEERYEDALSIYDMIQDIDPLNVGLRLKRSRLLTGLERYEEAIFVCKDALHTCPEDPSIHHQLGVIYQRMGRDDAAIEAFREALRFEPDNRWLREYVEFLEPEDVAAFTHYALGDEDVAALLARDVTPETYPRSDSVVLLDESITQLMEDGSTTSRVHEMIKILDDSGRDQWTRVALPPGANRVERAVVIQSDGSEVEATSISDREIHFSQLQPGAVIDYVFVGYAPANDWMSREYSEIFFFQSPDPVLLSRWILLTPASKPVNHWKRGEVDYRSESFEQRVVHVWEAHDVSPLEPEPNAPPGMELAAQVRVSTIQDWDTIAQWEHSLIKEQFEPDHDLLVKVQTLTEGKTNTQDKIRALANFVAQDIQYKILRGGIFGYKPNKAGNVLHNQWGDCKDKATLLITMLDAIGVDAQYATLRTRDAGQLVEEIPSNQCNHAIVYVPEGEGIDEPLWVDGTALEHGLDTLPWSDQDVTAMVWDDDGHMALMRTPRAPATNTINAFDLDVALRPDGSADVASTWTATGQTAAALRGAFKQPGQRSERLTQVLNGIVAGSVLKDASFSGIEDRDRNVAIDMQFGCSSYATADGDELSLRFKRPFQLTMQYAPREVRYYDVWIATTQVQRLDETIRVPEGFEIASAPESLSIEKPWMSYRTTIERERDALVIRRTLTIDALRIPRDEYDELRRFCISVDEYESKPIVIRRSPVNTDRVR